MIPDLLHFIYFQDSNCDTAYPLTDTQVACAQSFGAMFRPKRTIIWTNNRDVVKPLTDVGAEAIVVSRPAEIFGQPIKYVQHAVDVHRLLVLQKYGGACTDLDSLAIRDMQHFKQYDFVIGMERWRKRYACGIVMSRPGSDVVARWLETYRDFCGSKYAGHAAYKANPDKEFRKEQAHYWGYNSMEAVAAILDSPCADRVRIEPPTTFYDPPNWPMSQDMMLKEEFVPKAGALCHHLYLSVRKKQRTLAGCKGYLLRALEAHRDYRFNVGK